VQGTAHHLKLCMILELPCSNTSLPVLLFHLLHASALPSWSLQVGEFQRIGLVHQDIKADNIMVSPLLASRCLSAAHPPASLPDCPSAHYALSSKSQLNPKACVPCRHAPQAHQPPGAALPYLKLGDLNGMQWEEFVRDGSAWLGTVGLMPRR